MSVYPNHPLDYAALQCLLDMGRAGTFSPAETRARIAMVLHHTPKGTK